MVLGQLCVVFRWWLIEVKKVEPIVKEVESVMLEFVDI